MNKDTERFLDHIDFMTMIYYRPRTADDRFQLRLLVDTLFKIGILRKP